MSSTFPIATYEAGPRLREATAGYRESSSSHRLSMLLMGLLFALATTVLLRATDGYIQLIGAMCALFALGMLATWFIATLMVLSVKRGMANGLVVQLPIAVLHYIRGLLATHGLTKYEQEFLTWVSTTKPRFEELQNSRSTWDKTRSAPSPVNQAVAAQGLLLAINSLIEKFHKDDHYRKKSKD